MGQLIVYRNEKWLHSVKALRASVGIEAFQDRLKNAYLVNFIKRKLKIPFSQRSQIRSNLIQEN
jgi:hypothetical protein